MAGKIFLS
jgi:hypothetical protein